MTNMTMAFDGVRELSAEEIEEVNGALVGRIRTGVALARMAVSVWASQTFGGSDADQGGDNTNNGDVNIEIDGDFSIEGDGNCIGLCQGN